MKTWRFWSQKERSFIIKYARKKPAWWIAKYLKRTELSVTNYACRAGISLAYYTNANGEGFINADGYRRIPIGAGRTQLEHRFIMEKKLKRKLRKDETVHHRNGRRADNHPRNLTIRLKGNHPVGISPQDAAQWLRSLGYKVRKSS